MTLADAMRAAREVPQQRCPGLAALEAAMSRISMTNGLSYVDAGDLTEEEARRAAEIIAETGGELAERVHIEMVPCEPHEYVERCAEVYEREHGESLIVC